MSLSSHTSFHSFLDSFRVLRESFASSVFGRPISEGLKK